MKQGPCIWEGRKDILEPRMIYIPAGEVERQWEREMRKVFVRAFCISKYPITFAQFEKFAEDGGYERREYWTQVGWEMVCHNYDPHPIDWRSCRTLGRWRAYDFKGPNYPVCPIYWDEAYAYCRWLFVKTGKRYRLPSKAEWWRAALGSARSRYATTDWRFGLRVLKSADIGHPVPVGTRPTEDSQFGVSDMATIVEEWTGSPDPHSYEIQQGGGPAQLMQPYILEGDTGANAYLTSDGADRRDSATLEGYPLGFRVALSLDTD